MPLRLVLTSNAVRWLINVQSFSPFSPSTKRDVGGLKLAEKIQTRGCAFSVLEPVVCLTIVIGDVCIVDFRQQGYTPDMFF